MYRAKETFWAPGNRRIVKGDLIAPHDPVVKGREGLFEAVVIPQAIEPAQAAAARQESEQASDAPGTAGNGDNVPQQPANDGDGSPPAAGDTGGEGSPPQPPTAAKKTTAKKTTTATRKPAGGDAK